MHFPRSEQNKQGGYNLVGLTEHSVGITYSGGVNVL